MKDLIIDTATNKLIVGLNIDNKHYFKTRLGRNDNAAFLVNHIKELLEENNLELKDLDNIIVGVGPGSYTGIRVGVVVAKTLSHFNNIPLKTISSLKLLSSNYKGSVIAAIDARRGHYFAHSHNSGITVMDDVYIKSDELENEVILLDENTININLDIVSRESVLYLNVLDLEPNYLRKTEAENNVKKS